MRIKMFLLALVAGLATALPVNAQAVLGFGIGTIQPPPGAAFDPNTPLGAPGNPNGGSSIDPHTLVGLNSYDTLGTRLGSTNGATLGTVGNPWIIDANTTSQVIIQIQLRDSAPNTFPNTNGNTRMFQWGVRLDWTLGGPVTGTPDNDPNNGQAYTATVNDSAGASNENIPYANNNQTPNSFGLGNIFFTAWNSTGSTFQDGGLPSTAASQPRNYILANVLLNINPAGGNATLSMSDMNLSQINWSNGAGTPLDAAVFATIPQLFIQVTPVPEPSSMALAGLAVSGLVYRLRRKKAAVVA